MTLAFASFRQLPSLIYLVLADIYRAVLLMLEIMAILFYPLHVVYNTIIIQYGAISKIK